MAFEYFIAILIFAVIVWYLGEPLFFGVAPEIKLNEARIKQTEDLTLRKEEVLLTLKDLELDFKMKKISEADYRMLYNEALQQGTDLVKKLDAVASAKTAVVMRADSPAQAKPLAKEAGGSKFCTNCGTPLVAGAKFCGECGQKAAV